MKNKKNIIWLAIICLSLFFSCQNEELHSPENTTVNSKEQISAKATKEEIVTINHTYDYYGERFKVSYVYNQVENEVLKAYGDVDIAQKIFGDEERSAKSLFFENPSEKSTDIKVKVFNNADDLKKYTSRIAKGFPGDDVQEIANDVASKCNSYDIWGTGNFYFYKHIYYNTEMTGMRRSPRYYYRDHWVGSGYNDQLSSLIVTKPANRRAVVYLYQHWCFGGRIIGFYQSTGYSGFGIPNLKWYTMSGWWWWRKSWNDQVSSTSGWAW